MIDISALQAKILMPTTISYYKNLHIVTADSKLLHLYNGYKLLIISVIKYSVCFILEKGDKVIGLEVKSGMKVENKGLSIFAERFHPEKILLVGTDGVPYDEFLKINPKELF